jgi:hypothetical protein
MPLNSTKCTLTKNKSTITREVPMMKMMPLKIPSLKLPEEKENPDKKVMKDPEEDLKETDLKEIDLKEIDLPEITESLENPEKEELIEELLKTKKLLNNEYEASAII